MSTETQIERANKIVAWYTLAASATGAIPAPIASTAIVAQNGCMISHVARALGVPINLATVFNSLGLAASLNIVGRNIFIEGAKWLSWGTGSVWALVGLSTLGAATAGLQTYIIGSLAIEIGKNAGDCISPAEVNDIIDYCKQTYDSFVGYWAGQKLPKPI